MEKKIIKVALGATCAYLALAAGIAVGSAIVRLLSNPFVLIGVAGCLCGLHIGRKGNNAKRIDSGKAGADPEERGMIVDD